MVHLSCVLVNFHHENNSDNWPLTWRCGFRVVKCYDTGVSVQKMLLQWQHHNNTTARVDDALLSPDSDWIFKKYYNSLSCCSYLFSTRAWQHLTCFTVSLRQNILIKSFILLEAVTKFVSGVCSEPELRAELFRPRHWSNVGFPLADNAGFCLNLLSLQNYAPMIIQHFTVTC